MIVGGAQETGKYTAEHFHKAGDQVLLVTGPESGREGHMHVEAPTHVEPALVRRPSPPNDLRALWRLYRLFRRERPTIVHSRTAKARFLAPLAARLARVPVVIQTIHGFSFNNEVDRFRGVYVLLERAVARLCHTNVVVSEVDLEEGTRLRILRPETTALIRSGVDIRKMNRVDPSAAAAVRARYAPEGETLITLVGRLSRPKTPEVVVEAAALVLRDHPGARFLLVGDGDEREALNSRIESLGLSDRVLLLGLRHDVPEILAATDVVLHSSTHEGLPKTVLEGMAAGKPVVATAVGGVPVVVEDGVTGLLVPSSDPEGLATAVLRIIADPAAAEQLTKEASRRLFRFSHERTLEDTEALYTRLDPAGAPR
jgi:glycosyltransferase involved in cell wall biosynthesis